jgi:hypothetical protein
MPLEGKHPFEEATLAVWAPEEDASQYYGTFHPAAFTYGVGDNQPELAADSLTQPPSGVDASAFYNLVEWRSKGYSDNLFTIDRAANNTSVVFCIEWRGWKLLFPGDAEIRSWKTMDKYGVLQPIHFLKVAHHGSSNGTPAGDLLDKLFPAQASDARPRAAVVSTFPNTYAGVPDQETFRALSERCELHNIIEGKKVTRYIDLLFEG